MLRVLVTALTSPDLLTAQARALDAFLPPHKLTVVNDAYAAEHFSNLWACGVPGQLHEAAEAVGAKHYRLRQRHHNQRNRIFPGADFCENPDATSRCADAVQYGVNKLLRQSLQPILILDADMFPFKPVPITEMLREAPLWGVTQGRGDDVEYLWNGLLLIDPKRVNRLDLFNLDCGEVLGERVDVGGQLHWFLKENQGLLRSEPHFISGIHPWESLQAPPRVEEFMRWCEARNGGHSGPEVHWGAFLHLRAGGNWDLKSREEMLGRYERFIEATCPA